MSRLCYRERRDVGQGQTARWGYITRATGLQRNFSFGGVITGDKVGERSCAFTILVFPELQLHRVPLFPRQPPYYIFRSISDSGKERSPRMMLPVGLSQKEDILVLQKVEIIFCLNV